jgi:hypothetical protein
MLDSGARILLFVEFYFLFFATLAAKLKFIVKFAGAAPVATSPILV